MLGHLRKLPEFLLELLILLFMMHVRVFPLDGRRVLGGLLHCNLITWPEDMNMGQRDEKFRPGIFRKIVEMN